MHPSKKLMLDEKGDLDEKLKDLSGFLTCDLYAVLPAADKYRLDRQCKIMQLYSDVLRERIDAFDA